MKLTDQKLKKLLESYRNLKESGLLEDFALPTNNVSSGAIAGTPASGDDPPVDFRRKKYKKLNMFYRKEVKKLKTK